MIIKANDKFVKLKVMEALQEDAYKGIARIDTATMKQLNVRPGDVIVISGSRETIAIVDRAYPADVGEKIIRIDGIIRRNAKTGIGELVNVIKADVKEAKKVIIAPARKGVIIRAGPGAIDNFKRGLLGRAVMQGDLVVLGGAKRRQELMASSFEDLFDIFGEAFGGMGNFGFPGSEMKFIVAQTQPKQPVIITETTELVLNPRAVEITEERIPEVTYEDIGGLDEEVKKIREMVELPLKHPEIFSRLGIEPPKGVLLYGPPGCGKTLLAKAVATESEANFIQVKGPSLLSMWVGKSEEGVRKIFERAKQVAPCIIFFDEIDALASKRGIEIGNKVTERVLNQLLAEMDGIENLHDVVVIGATNRPDMLDPALLRPGRFDRIIFTDAPNAWERLEIFKVHTKNMPLAKDVNLKLLAQKKSGYSGADIEAICREAGMLALRENIKAKEVKKKHFEEAMKKFGPSITEETIRRYKEIEKKYLRNASSSLEKPIQSYTG